MISMSVRGHFHRRAKEIERYHGKQSYQYSEVCDVDNALKTCGDDVEVFKKKLQASINHTKRVYGIPEQYNRRIEFRQEILTVIAEEEYRNTHAKDLEK